MKQAVTVAPGSIQITEAAEPAAPREGEALLEIACVGLCGSDLEMFKGTDPYSRFPCRQGHEYSARIAELHSHYQGPLRAGDLVAVEPLLPCGACIACRRGRPNCCVDLRVTGGQIDGALVERMVMPVTNLYEANDLDPESAAFVEPVSIGMQMVARSMIGADEKGVVLGAGPIGLSVVLAAKDRGAQIMAVDLLEARLEMARSSGAASTANAARADVADAVRAWTNGEGPLVVFEATGVPAVMRQAIDLVAHSGTVVIAGTPTDDLSFPAMWLIKKEINLLGSRNNAGLFGEAVRVVRENRAVVARIVTHRFGFRHAQAAMEFAIAHPAEVGKVMVTVGS